MIKFTAIKLGNFGPVSVNRRFRALTEEVNRLSALVDAGALNAPGAPVSAEDPNPDTKTEDSAGTATELNTDAGAPPTAPDVDAPKGFDWKNSKSLVDLRNYAFMDLGLTIAKQVTNPETVKKRIQAHLDKQAGE